jgi:hypothetical protein
MRTEGYFSFVEANKVGWVDVIIDVVVLSGETFSGSRHDDLGV